VLLALDAGNSNITIGAFEGSKLLCQWRLRTVHEQTADEWGILLRNLFSPVGLDIDAVDGIIISSVVPPIDSTLAFMARTLLSTPKPCSSARAPIWASAILYDNPNEVGADRLVNGVAGFYKYGGPCVIVDLGTTINFDVVSRDGEYLGGAIAVGRHRHRSPLQPNRAPAAGRFPAAQGRDRHQHGGQHAVGFVLWRGRHDRRHSGAHHRSKMGPTRRPSPPAARRR
jgi:pantothenate kinase type III